MLAIHARQIFDSRGNPTVEVDLTTAKGKDWKGTELREHVTKERARAPPGRETSSSPVLRNWDMKVTDTDRQLWPWERRAGRAKEKAARATQRKRR